MARTANNPLQVPKGVDVKLDSGSLSIKGGKGTLALSLDRDVDVKQEGTLIRFAARNDGKRSRAMAGTTRALVRNMLAGVTQGYQKKLELQGVGYRAQAQGKKLNLTLGFSHAIQYDIPEGVQVQTPSQTEIVVTGVDKQLVGQVAAEIRAFRKPEPYKGKGVRYAGERVRRKEAKKK
jgi:large subunit ribosomal protein L6